MGRFILKHIDMTLDPESIDKAIKAVNDFETDLHNAMTKLCEYLLETGVEIAKINLAAHHGGSDRSGALRDSIKHGVFDVSKGIGVITAGEGLTTQPPYGSYAVFVEYGTGIYNMNGDGRQTPWVYYDDYIGQWVTTQGQAPKMFMGNTLIELESIAEQSGGEIIATYIYSVEG